MKAKRFCKNKTMELNFVQVFVFLVLHSKFSDAAKENSQGHSKVEDNDESSEEYVYEDGFPEEEPIFERQQNNVTNKYEIYENVLDIPNNMTLLGPIVTNYTLNKPLNNATATVLNISESNIPLQNNNGEKQGNNVPKRHSISIFHVKAEIDNETHKFTHVFDFSNHVNYLKDYINGVKRGLVNGVNTLINTRLDKDVNSGVYVPNVVAAPIKFLNTLHEKSSDVAYKLHDYLFRRKNFHD